MQKLYAAVDTYSFFRRNMENPSRNPHRLDGMSKNMPSKYIATHCYNDMHRLQECAEGGHCIPKGGHCIVSGIVRAKVK